MNLKNLDLQDLTMLLNSWNKETHSIESLAEILFALKEKKMYTVVTQSPFYVSPSVRKDLF
jgi:hypothetical protein